MTRIHGVLFFATANSFVAVDLDNLDQQLLVHPLPLFPAAYFGELVDVVQ